jgi:hypothetical protein
MLDTISEIKILLKKNLLLQILSSVCLTYFGSYGIGYVAVAVYSLFKHVK